jgi:hypothetical protein
MKVFLSWSGERARAVGDVFRRWIPSVLQAVRPYYSPDDITKGSRWASEIAKELDASRIGLILITPENQDSAWLNFEAGALAKNLDRSKVCPLIFGDIEATDLKGPLVQFQAAQFSEAEMKRVIKMINGELGESALAAEVLEGVFGMWWPRLEEQVAEALENTEEEDTERRRSERDLIEEVLALTRGMARDRDRRPDLDHPVWSDLLMSASNLATTAAAISADERLQEAIASILRPMEYLAHRGGRASMRVTVSAREACKAVRHCMKPDEADSHTDDLGDLIPDAEARN